MKSLRCERDFAESSSSIHLGMMLQVWLTPPHSKIQDINRQADAVTSHRDDGRLGILKLECIGQSGESSYFHLFLPILPLVFFLGLIGESIAVRWEAARCWTRQSIGLYRVLRFPPKSDRMHRLLSALVQRIIRAIERYHMTSFVGSPKRANEHFNFSERAETKNDL